MYRIILNFFMVLVLGFILIGCSDNDSGDSSHKGSYESNLDGLKIEKISLSSSQIPINSLQLVKVDIDSPIDYVNEVNSTAAFIYFELTDLSKADDNISDATIWLSSFALDSMKQGKNSYEFNITMPSDIDIGQYALYAEVSDQQKSLDNNSSDLFDVISFGGKPELELVSFKLGIEDGGIDSEFDTILSYEDPEISRAKEMLENGISLDDLNKTLVIHSSITVRSHYMSAKDVKVKVCVRVNSECIQVPILDIIDSNLTISHASEEAFVQSDSPPTQTLQLNLGDFDENEKKNFDLTIVLDSKHLIGIVNDAIKDPNAFSDGKIKGELKIEISSTNEGDLNLADNTIFYPLNIRLSNKIYDLMSNSQGSISLEDLQDYINILDGIPNGDIPITLPVTLPRSASGKCGLKKYKFGDDYDNYKYGDYFGAGAYLKGETYLDIEGAHSMVYGSIRIKIPSKEMKKHRIFRIKGSVNIIPASFEDTGYDIEVSSFGTNIFAKSMSISEKLGLDSPTVTLTTKEKRKIRNSNESNATDRNVTRESTLLRQKAYKAAKKKIKKYKETQSTLLSYSKEFKVAAIPLERSINAFIGPIPIVVTAGAEATIGFKPGIRLDGITSVTAIVEPRAFIGAYLQAGVGWDVTCCGKEIKYVAGISGKLWLISERFTTTANASLEFMEDDKGEYIVALNGKLQYNITNKITTMSGKLYAYTDYTKWVCKYRRHPCKAWNWEGKCTKRGNLCTSWGWKDYHKEKIYANWKGKSYPPRQILDKSVNLFTVPIVDNCE